MKKLIAVFPLIIMMLLYAVPLRSAAEGTAQDYFLDPGIREEYSLQDKDSAIQSLQNHIDNYSTMKSAILNGCGNMNFDNYFYAIFIESWNMDNFINRVDNSNVFTVFIANVDNTEPVYSHVTIPGYSDFFTVYSIKYGSYFRCKYYFNNFTYLYTFASVSYSKSSSYPAYLVYNESTGNVDFIGKYAFYENYSGSDGITDIYDANFSSSFNTSLKLGQQYQIVQETNIPDFPFCPGLGGSSSSGLDVNVSFNPEFDLGFTRRVKSGSSVSTLENFSFSVTNNCNYPIQYSFYIIEDEKRYDFTIDNISLNSEGYAANKTYGGHPTFVYLSNEWTYLPNKNGSVTKSLNPCVWHYVNSKDSVTNTLSFSQLKLSNDRVYRILFYAIRCDSDCVLSCSYYRYLFVENCPPSQYLINFQDSSLIYEKVFDIFDPAIFNSSNNDNDCYAFDPDNKDIDLLFRQSSAHFDDNNNLQIGAKDSYLDFSFNPLLPGILPNDTSYAYSYTSNNVPSDIVKTSENFSAFFSFVNSIFNFFPKQFIQVITTGLVSIICVALLKVVFR